MPIQLEVKNLHKQYGAFVALNNVSFKVNKGSILGLLGPNGAGKTSLIRLITQITQPDSGSIFFNEQNLNPTHSAQISYLPEERGLYKKMQVGDQLIYLAQLKGLSKSQALQNLAYWVECFAIKSWWNKKIEELSKGMQQKIQFIAAVMQNPELLILDEPFSGFDPINAGIITAEILKLKQQGTTIIFSTHRMETVEQLCDDIVLLNQSKIILDGNLFNIKQQFKKNEFELQCNNLLSQLNSNYQVTKQSETENGIVTYTLLKNKHITNNQLLSELLKQTEIISFSEILPGINDIFVELVREKTE